ncbi:MAG: glycosyltransferase family 2 protein [Desulfomonilia bacterium]|jgi:glycosyltransferase involved in cell wall biosynthesis
MPERQKLTVLIPCFNEERNMEECLKSVSWADEIFIVDSYSTDRTLDIAKAYTDRIVQHEFINDAVQKNWAIPQATYDWILIVDCDERVPPELRDEIIDLLSNDQLKDGYWIFRKNYLMNKHVKYSSWGNDSVLRLFRKSKGRYEEKRVHGEIILSNTGVLNSTLDHYTVPSMGEWVNKINRYTLYKAQDKYDKGITFPVLYMLVRPPLRFLKDYVLRLGILDGWRGFLISAMGAFADLVMTAKLLEMTYDKGQKG